MDVQPNPPSAAVIDVRAISTRFGDAVVHEDVSLAVNAGEIFALVGGSGSGKSTLLREIILLQQPASGSIRVFGQEVADSPTTLHCRCAAGGA